ncbi:MAG: hypothetical protein M1817_003104 [Caeruleum heppii]|nr:MAG: hypothetical protein M1817_003104 [Caeruleum heppii]
MSVTPSLPMAEPSGDTPGSGPESTPARNPAPKDKHCPYCNQGFTSSSLGRHLDLYIKEKNPKPPDGVHNIDEIRRLRGGITRRQARTSSVRANSSTPANRKQSTDDAQASPSTRDIAFEGFQPSKVRNSLNEPNWQVTGVMRDLPPSSRDGASSFSGRREMTRSTNNRAGIEQKQRLRSDMIGGQAAELALREVLGSVKAANARLRVPTSPFNTDPFQLTYPALILDLLPRPSTLFSTSPFPTSHSFPLEAPGSAYFELALKAIRNLYTKYRAERASLERRKESNSSYGETAGGFPQDNGVKRGETSSSEDQDEENRVVRHLNEAFDAWKGFPEKQKQELWNLEILRAYAKEQDRREEALGQLDRAQQKIAGLKAQIDRLSKCQQPRDYLLHPPSTIPLSKEATKELEASTADWDYDRLISKWKTVIQTNRGLSGQRSLPGSPAQIHASANASYTADLNGDYQEDGEMRTEGEIDRPPHNRAPPAGIDRGVLDPHLHSNGGQMVMGGHDDATSEGLLGGRMLMGLSGYGGMEGSNADSMEH